MLFGSRVGFSGAAEIMVQLSNFKNPRWRYTRTAVARNPCVSWAFLVGFVSALLQAMPTTTVSAFCFTCARCSNKTEIKQCCWWSAEIKQICFSFVSVLFQFHFTCVSGLSSVTNKSQQQQQQQQEFFHNKHYYK